MIVTVGSVRGSPGVTSWSLLLAAAWPAESAAERVVLEADPDGGVLGVRYGLGVEPGAVSLLAALRHTLSSVPVEDHGRHLGDVWVVPGPEAAERARSVWSSSAEAAAAHLVSDDRLLLVDAGRLHSANPSRVFVGSSVMTVLVSGRRLEDLVQLPSRIASLPPTSGGIGVLVVGKSGYDRAELADFVGISELWTVDHHADLVELSGQLLGGGRGRRSWLWRQAVDVARAIAEASAVTTRPSAEVRR